MNLYSGLTYWGQNTNSYALNCQTLVGFVVIIVWTMFSLFMLISADQINVQSLTILPRIIQIRERRILKYQNFGWTFLSQINHWKGFDFPESSLITKSGQARWKKTIMSRSYQLTNSICSLLIFVLFLCVLSQDSPNDWSQRGISYLSPSVGSMTWEINI